MIPTIVFALLRLLPASDLPVAPPPRDKVAAVEHIGEFYGDVVAVTNRSITVRGADTARPGNQQIIRYFEANAALMAGRQDPRERRSDDYRLSDVKVGDKVYLMLHPAGDDDICAAVRIRRRPGGLVPPAPFEDPDVRIPHHVAARAYQAFEEKGIPLPPELDPKAREARDAANLESQRKYHEYLKKLDKGLIAPPPRPVNRK